MERRDRGWQDSSAAMSMRLKNRRGDESTRELRLKSLEMPRDGDKGLVVFDRPADLKGTAFLSFSHTLEPDDQWLYLPALKRVKRISSRNKSGPFMGSEFAYEDLTSFEVDKYHYKYLREEELEGRKTYVVEQYPRYEYSGYTKQVNWVDAERYIPLRIAFYDRKEALLKTLVLKDYRRYLDRYWRAHDQLMTNHQSGKTTRLLFDDWAFQAGLDAGDFTKVALKRTR
ncbi:outer membrane lipoprotein-sorting protein [Endothiovibrio diazotrophicus]